MKKKSTATMKKTNVRISADVHRQLKIQAAALDVALGTLAAQYLEKVMDEEERTNERLRHLRQMREAAR